MLLGAVFLIAVVLVPLAGGRLMALAELRFARAWALTAALGIQVLIVSVIPGRLEGIHAPIHLATYLLAAWFLVGNLRVPGMWLIASGGLMNAVAIAANGGVMPASAPALRTAGLSQYTGEYENSTTLADPNLAFLGDVFALPASVPLANVFSIGDVLIALGAAYGVHRLCGSRLVPRRDGEFTALWRYADFANVWMAHAVSSIGDWVYALAVVAILAGQGAPPHTLATLLLLQVGPAALAGLLGGPLVDRLPRKRLMIATDVVRAGAVTSVLVSGQPSIGHLYAVAVCLGVGGALFQPSLQASLPSLVPRARLVAANALINANFHLAVTVGPLLGGLLVASLGATPAFAINAASFVVSACLVAQIRARPAAANGASHRRGRDLVEGLRYSLATPLVRGILAVTGLVMFAVALRSPLEPLFVIETLAGTPEALGILGAAWGLGMLVGSAAAPRTARRWPRERLLWMSLGLVGGSVFAASQAWALLPVIFLWVAAGVGNALATVSYESLLQERTPDALRGRVIAASECVLDAAFAIGLLVVGPLTALMGIRAAYAVSGTLLVAAAIVSRVLIGGTARGGIPACSDQPLRALASRCAEAVVSPSSRRRLTRAGESYQG